MLRLASSKVVPTAIRAITSPIILSGSITNRKSYVSNESSFSTVADLQKLTDEELLKLLKSEVGSEKHLLELLKSRIKYAGRFISDIQVPEPPTGFPFEIEDIPGEWSIKLTREFAGENIIVYVQQAWNPKNKNVKSNTSDENSDDQDKPWCFFAVVISEENGEKWLDISCRANVDSIGVRYVDIYETAHSKADCDLFEGDDFDTVPYRLEMDRKQNYWKKKVLEIRGIDVCFGRFLIDYMIRRFRRDALLYPNKVID